MTQFHFRLQSLLKLRKLQRDRCREALADAYRADQILQSRESELAEEVHTARQEKRQFTEGGPLEVNRLLDTYRYELLLQSQLRTLERQRLQIAQETERRRLAAVEAEQELQVLEKLRQRQAEAHARQEDKVVTRTMDDIALRQYRVMQEGIGG